jgi:hypothetical protein
MNLSLKSIPNDLHALLKDSARRNLNSEILARLQSQFTVPVADRAVRARVRALRLRVADLPWVDHGQVARYKRQGRM